MTPERKELVELGIEFAKTGIKQAKRAMELEGDEGLEMLRASWSNLTDAGAYLWRSRTGPDGK